MKCHLDRSNGWHPQAQLLVLRSVATTQSSTNLFGGVEKSFVIARPAKSVGCALHTVRLSFPRKRESIVFVILSAAKNLPSAFKIPCSAVRRPVEIFDIHHPSSALLLCTTRM